MMYAVLVLGAPWAWAAFEEIAARGQEESGELRMILEDGAAPQAVLERYVALGKACGACHDRYREPIT